jgi:hypothetical protein
MDGVSQSNLGPLLESRPQRTLYVPGPLLREGSNELAILELQGSSTMDVKFLAGTQLGLEDGWGRSPEALARLQLPSQAN